jgi:lysozyme
MNIDKLREEVTFDEGVKYETYHCSEGHLTGGIGHLITEWDEDYYDKPIGTPISEEQVNEWFAKDIEVSINDCKDLFNNFEVLPEDVQRVLANMSFQLGRPRLGKFKKMIAAVEIQDFAEMANQMEDSRWFRQTPKRAQRLIERVIRHGVPS